jgi:hypothetical protein
VADIKRGLSAALVRENLDGLAPLVGRDMDAVAKEGPGV